MFYFLTRQVFILFYDNNKCYVLERVLLDNWGKIFCFSGRNLEKVPEPCCLLTGFTTMGSF